MVSLDSVHPISAHFNIIIGLFQLPLNSVHPISAHFNIIIGLFQLPLDSEHPINTDFVLNVISPDKDVDGFVFISQQFHDNFESILDETEDRNIL